MYILISASVSACVHENKKEAENHIYRFIIKKKLREEGNVRIYAASLTMKI